MTTAPSLSAPMKIAGKRHMKNTRTSTASSPANAPCKAVGLVCEFLASPLGLETRTPRLSWRLEDARAGARQVVEELPFVAGVVAFGFQNLADSEGQGWGLVDNEGRPYRDYVEGVADAARWLGGFLARP